MEKRRMPKFDGKFEGNRQLLGRKRYEREDNVEEDRKRNKVRLNATRSRERRLAGFAYPNPKTARDSLTS
jgi:hypothetical protein